MLLNCRHIDVENMLTDVLYVEKLQQVGVQQRTKKLVRMIEVNMNSSDKIKNEKYFYI